MMPRPAAMHGAPREEIMQTTPRLVTSFLACLAAVLLVACDGGSDRAQPPAFGGGAQAPLVVTCVTGGTTVMAGSPPILVLARVTRGNIPMSGVTVSFSASRGVLQPAEVVTDAEGMATVQFTPPGTTGEARITITATDRRGGDTATTTCSIQVQSARNPRLNVQLIIPDSAAGVQVTVQYDPARVTLPAGNARPAGAFAGAACLALANDSGFGIVRLDIACSSLQSAVGPVAVFDFLHLTGQELATRDFTVSCAAFDEQGRSLGAACATSVTQL